MFFSEISIIPKVFKFEDHDFILQVPGILTGLQKSVQAVLLGKSILPDWLTQGVKQGSEIDKFKIEDLPDVSGIYHVLSLHLCSDHIFSRFSDHYSLEHTAGINFKSYSDGSLTLQFHQQWTKKYRKKAF